MKFTSKAQTLFHLRDKLKLSTVLRIQCVLGDAWLRSKEAVVEDIQAVFPNQSLIVRSSSKNEDSYQSSSAGKYMSVLNVCSGDNIALKKAIDDVFASYGVDVADEECFCQPMLENIKISGVAFTADITTNAPYYVINYSQTDSAAITSGAENGFTFIAYKSDLRCVMDSAMKAVISALRELESLCGNEFLDVEFAIDTSDKLYLLQVRPIVRYLSNPVKPITLDTPLNKLYKKVEKLMRPHPFLNGATTCFGVMPDWNPAEILGIRPKKLAISLYKELITDSIWAHQRNDYGYSDLTLHPLMVSFCGIPYIDVRVSFNSFIPKGLTTELSKKLADYYIDKFKNYPKLHDKVEFEIVFSCYYFGLPGKLHTLLQDGFTENEIKRIEFALLILTNEVIKPANSVFYNDIVKIDELIKRHDAVINSDISDVDKIYWLIENCKMYGTLPFAGVARAGFIAVQFLRSFVEQEIISSSEYDNFMSSLHTVSKEIKEDTTRLLKGELSKGLFLEKYGHIRPNTYDITSFRYDEAFDLYFGGSPSFGSTTEKAFVFSAEQKKRIQYELDQNGLTVTTEELISFIKDAIEAREYVKFIFTRSVSEVLKTINRLGNSINISTEDLAHLDIIVIKQLYSDLYYSNLSKIFLTNIEMNKRQHDCALMLKLPSIITKPEDVYSFYLTEDEPNFITHKSLQAKVACEIDLRKSDLRNKIVFIESADPGYDFLFTKEIAGLITQFGGANSHMAIRCAESGIPAIIGAGEKNYSRWKQHKELRIDCANHRVSCVN